MQTHDLVQGSDLWHEFRASHFGASEAAAMLGLSKYTTRSELLYQKHTGISKEVDQATQARFDKGHETEALARRIIEAHIGEGLSPVTMSDGTLSCSCDGLNFDGDIAWEHKLDGNALFSSVAVGTMPEEHLPQCQQVLMITGAKKLIFTVSNGTAERMASLEVYPDPAWFERIRTGWAAFHRDLETYTPPEIIPEIIAAPIKDLPAITYKMDGMSLSTNLRNDVKPAILALVEQSKRKLETDQDFADLDALCKKFKQAEEQCALVQSQAVGEIKDVDAFCRDLKELSEIMRQARIAGEKAVTSEKEARKLAIVSKAGNDFTAYIQELEAETRPIQLNVPRPDFAGAIKGMKKLAAMQEEVDTALRNGKFAADQGAKDIRAKLAWCKDNAAVMSFLFPDLAQIITKPLDDFTLLITSRIKDHKDAEAKKLEEQTARIRAKVEEEQRQAAEAQAKIDREAAEKLKAEQDAIDAAAQREHEKALAGEPYVLQPAEAAKNNPPQSQVAKPASEVVIERQAEISAFLASRDFGKEEGKVRAILVEFVKFSAQFNSKKAA